VTENSLFSPFSLFFSCSRHVEHFLFSWSRFFSSKICLPTIPTFTCFICFCSCCSFVWLYSERNSTCCGTVGGGNVWTSRGTLRRLYTDVMKISNLKYVIMMIGWCMVIAAPASASHATFSLVKRGARCAGRSAVADDSARSLQDCADTCERMGGRESSLSSSSLHATSREIPASPPPASLSESLLRAGPY
jgi:hypothetical protein